MLPREKFADYQGPDKTLPRPEDHHQEWIAAIKSGGEALANFAYGGRMTEAVQAGIIAYRTGQRLEWDGPAMRATNYSPADALVQPKFRQGWEL